MLRDMSANIIEVSASSDTSFEEAIRRAVQLGVTQLPAVTSSRIRHREHVSGDDGDEYRVVLTLTAA